MNHVKEVLIPLLNPNEPEALLAELHVKSGQPVNAGQPLCTLETTKSTAELTAEIDGYVCELHLTAGQSVQAGERLCYLADSPDWTAPTPATPTAEPTALPAELRITQPALSLARSAGVDLDQLPLDKLVTERVVQELLNQSAPVRAKAPVDPNAILVYGGGGHGKALIDLLKSLNTYRIVAVVDDNLPIDSEVLGVPVHGGSHSLGDLYAEGVRLAVNAVGGIGNLGARLKVFERLTQAGFSCPTVIHPSAVIEPSARLAEGVQVMPLAYIGSEAVIGYGVIINTGAIVSHDCHVGAYSNLSPGSILAGEVQLGTETLVGMSATINLRVKIGNHVRIGNGATVKSDLPDGSIVRAGGIWPE